MSKNARMIITYNPLGDEAADQLKLIFGALTILTLPPPSDLFSMMDQVKDQDAIFIAVLSRKINEGCMEKSYYGIDSKIVISGCGHQAECALPYRGDIRGYAGYGDRSPFSHSLQRVECFTLREAIKLFGPFC